jgi:hypothetical protein
VKPLGTPCTRHFVKRLADPGLTLVQIAKRLQADVRQMAASVGHEQTPAYYDQVVGDVVLNQTGRAQQVAQPLDRPRPQQQLETSRPQTAALPPAAGQQFAPPEQTAVANPIVAELNALAAAQSWRELGVQLTTVQPTARDAHWASLAEKAAIGELTPLTRSSDHFDGRLTAVDHYLTTFPTLRGSEKFLALRASIGLGAFGDCFDRAFDRGSGVRLVDCRRGLESFLRAVPPGTELARDAARLVARKFNRAAAAPFFVIAVEAPAGAGTPVCADTELASVVVAALGMSPDRAEAEVKAAVSLADACWDALNTAIVAQVAREVGGYFLQNACPTLLQRNALTGLREARCRELTAR